jgi:hypothetical protein
VVLGVVVSAGPIVGEIIRDLYLNRARSSM